MAEIVVEDNGPGRAARPASGSLQAFLSRRRPKRNGVESGAGLGLAIVHDIMALHRGSVHYEDAPEGGARFIVRIPLVPIDVQAIPRPLNHRGTAKKRRTRHR